MKIETKYKLGQKIYVVYMGNKEVHIYEGYIEEIYYNDKGLGYLDNQCNEFTEEQITTTLEGAMKEVDRLLKEIENGTTNNK